MEGQAAVLMQALFLEQRNHNPLVWCRRYMRRNFHRIQSRGQSTGQISPRGRRLAGDAARP